VPFPAVVPPVLANPESGELPDFLEPVNTYLEYKEAFVTTHEPIDEAYVLVDPAVAARTAPVHARIASVIPAFKWPTWWLVS